MARVARNIAVNTLENSESQESNPPNLEEDITEQYKKLEEDCDLIITRIKKRKEKYNAKRV